MTVQKYFTPNGQDINGNGITPDIIVEAESGQDEEKPAEAESETIGDGPDESESGADGEKSAETEAGSDDRKLAEVETEAEAEEPDPVLERAIEELKD